MRPKLLLATNNAGKVKEYYSLLQGIPFDIVTPKELKIVMDVAETGVVTQTLLGALGQATQGCAVPVIADSRRGLRGFPPVIFRK